MVYGAKDSVVPFKEVRGFLIEAMELRHEETIEVLEHEAVGMGGACSSRGRLDGSIVVRVAEVQD